jgi:delta-aminolevulinic acid dehydratase/porphobilinogen synthase
MWLQLLLVLSRLYLHCPDIQVLINCESHVMSSWPSIPNCTGAQQLQETGKVLQHHGAPAICIWKAYTAKQQDTGDNIFVMPGNRLCSKGAVAHYLVPELTDVHTAGYAAVCLCQYTTHNKVGCSTTTAPARDLQ